jgi:hypothetical protein
MENKVLQTEQQVQQQEWKVSYQINKKLLQIKI